MCASLCAGRMIATGWGGSEGTDGLRDDDV
jgi:hypothetical protein